VPGATSDDNFVAVKFALDPPLVADVRQLAPADEGATIAVSAEGSSYAAGQIVRYEWDANYDGARFTPDAEGVTATLPAGDDSPPRRVMLRVTTSDGLVAMAGPVPPQLRNLPPVVGPLNGPQLLAVGVGTTVVTGVATDPGGDRFTVHVDYGDGTGVDSAVGPGGSFVGGPHAYGARGTYTVTATVTDDDGAATTVQKEVRVVDVTGAVFMDRGDDGSRDTQDPPLAGMTVYADLDGDGAAGASEPAAVTGAGGDYLFDGLPQGTYQFRVVPPGGLREDTLPSQSAPVTVGAGSGGVRNFALTDRSRISGTIFNDANANGVRDAGEAALGLGAEVYIDGNDDGSFNVGELQAKAEPGAGYVFRNLEPGVYKVRFLRDVAGGRPALYVQTAPAGPGGHEGYTVTVGPAQVAGGNDFGAYAPPQNQAITGVIFDGGRKDCRSAAPQSNTSILPVLPQRRSPPVMAGSSSSGVVIIGCSRQPPNASRS